MTDIKNIYAKIRNLFCMSDFQKRYDEDDRIQVKTHNGKVLEKNEAFPYGYYAKAKAGKALIFCQGGNFDNFEILPVLKDPPVFRPALKDGDVAVYTGEGSYIVLREEGDLEIYTRLKGDIKVHCTGNSIIHVEENSDIHVEGNSNILVEGDSDCEIKGNSSILVEGDSDCEIKGNSSILVEGDSDCVVKGNSDILVEGDSDCVVKGNSNILVEGNSDCEVKGNSSILVEGNCDCEVKGNYAIKAGTFKVTAERIDLN